MPNSTLWQKSASHTKFRNCVAHSSAFTLAEVLVTLTILGILASIIVPSVVQRYQDRQTITAVKKAYSILDNAIQQMYVVEGNPYTWDLTGLDSNEIKELFGEKLSHYLDVKKYCGSAYGCFKGYPSCYITFRNGKNVWGTWLEANHRGKMLLKNNMAIAVDFNSTFLNDDKGILNLRVDINGKKGPNRYGYDVFFFHVDGKGINNKIKKGVFYTNDNGYVFNPNNCYYKSTQDSGLNGNSCSTWVMKHGNLDYKYRDVRAEW